MGIFFGLPTSWRLLEVKKHPPDANNGIKESIY
jgi:hypothetical protein